MLCTISPWSVGHPPPPLHYILLLIPPILILALQKEVGIYDTGVPRVRAKRVPPHTRNMEEILQNYGPNSNPSSAKGRRKPSASSDLHGLRLPSIGSLTPAEQAAEARPFLPPPDPHDNKVRLQPRARRASLCPVSTNLNLPRIQAQANEETLLVQYRHMKHELATLKAKVMIWLEPCQSLQGSADPPTI